MYQADDKDAEFTHTHTPQGNSICHKSPPFFHSHSSTLPPCLLCPSSQNKGTMSKISLKNNGLHLLSFLSHSLLLAFLMTSLEKPGGNPLRTEHGTTTSEHAARSTTKRTHQAHKGI